MAAVGRVGQDEAADGAQVLQAAGECRALLTAGLDRDWSRKLPRLDWTVAQAVTHVAEGTLWYATDLAVGPGRQRQVDWRWHCAPLEEWDGLNPSGRR